MNRDDFIAVHRRITAEGVDAFVLACIDYRIGVALAKFLTEDLRVIYTLKVDAGGVQQISAGSSEIRRWFRSNFKIGNGKHKAGRFILINHTDCAAYNGSAEHASLDDEIIFHQNELRIAAEYLRENFPGIEIEAYLAVLWEADEVGFLRIDVSPEDVDQMATGATQ